jgi:hypothetical protein
MNIHLGGSLLFLISLYSNLKLDKKFSFAPSFKWEKGMKKLKLVVHSTTVPSLSDDILVVGQ